MLTLGRLQARDPIVDGQGRPTPLFLRLFNIELVQRIESSEAAQSALIEQQAVFIQQLQAQQELVNQALELANIAIGGRTATSIEDINDLGWTLGPQIDLTGVVAGDLMIQGTSLQSVSTTRLNQVGPVDGQLRIVEIVGGVDTVVGGPWTFTTGRVEDPSSVPYIMNPGQIASYNEPRTTTGNVSYRLDARMDAFGDMTDVRFYLSVKRT